MLISNGKTYGMVCSHSPTPRLTKVGCTELCGSVHTAQRQTSTQIPMGFSTHFISTCVGLALGVGQCKCTIIDDTTFEIQGFANIVAKEKETSLPDGFIENPI